MGHNHQRLSKKLFTELLGLVWRVSMTPANKIAGFRSTGIFTVNPEVFPENEFDPVGLRNFRTKKNAEKKSIKGENLASGSISVPGNCALNLEPEANKTVNNEGDQTP